MTAFLLELLAREVLAEIAPMALEKGVDLSLAEGGRGEVTGYPVGPAILLRTLRARESEAMAP